MKCQPVVRRVSFRDGAGVEVVAQPVQAKVARAVKMMARKIAGGMGWEEYSRWRSWRCKC